MSSNVLSGSPRGELAPGAPNSGTLLAPHVPIALAAVGAVVHYRGWLEPAGRDMPQVAPTRQA